MSRGLEQKQAEKLMIRGFLGIVLSEISIKEVRQELIDTIERKLAQYDN
jgi:ABC-type transport system involved in Fe-S cluster assembly, permease component